MKKQLLFVMILLLAVSSLEGKVMAATKVTPSPSPTSTVGNLENQINNLKDRIASRVAQLNLVEKRGVLGTVTDVSETQITLTDIKGNTQFVDVDELTKFSSPHAKSSFGISDIQKGSTLGVIGLYNKDSQRLLGRWVDVQENPVYLSGAILSLDKKDYNFTLATADGKNITIEVETFTKTNAYTKDDGLSKAGFSKLQEGQRVIAAGFPDKSQKDAIMASRVIIFPNLPPDPRIQLVKPEDIAPVTPSTGSGKKLTPIVK